MALDVTETTVIPVDVEHNGLRLVVALVFVVAGIALYVVMAALIPAEVLNLLAILGALLGAAGIAYLTETQLKRRWQSGKSIKISRHVVALHQPRQADAITLNPDQALTLRWRFRIERRSRVPKGWYMVAAALEQDDKHITVYTLMSPQGYAAFDPDGRFTALEKTKESGDAGSLRLAGEQRRLHRAESLRWHEGVEMTNDDFIAYTGYLETFSVAK